MNKLDEVVIRGQIKAQAVKDDIVEKWNSKEHGDSQLVVALVLIAVAIGLCIIFRKQISDLITTLFEKITKQIGTMTDGAMTPQA